jgi:hypothetical protein
LLSIFKINDPYKILIVFLVAIIIQLPIFISGINITLPEIEWNTLGNKLVSGSVLYVDIYYPIGPLSAQVYRLLSYIVPDVYLVYRILGLMLVIVQAVIFNFSLINYKAYNHNTYVPSLIYVVLMMGMEDYITLSPQLMGLTFVLLSITLTFKLIEGRRRSEENFLKIGLFSGLSVLFYPLYIFLFLPILIALIFFTNTVIRRYLLLIFGLVLPLFLIWLKYFWYDQLDAFYFNLDFLIIPGNDGSIISWKGFIAILLVPGALLVYALLRVMQSTSFINYQVRLQKYYFLYIVIGILIIFLEYHQTSHILIILVPVIAFFITHLFLMMKRMFVSEILFFTFLSLMILQNYNASFELIKESDYFNFSNQFLKSDNQSDDFPGEKILVLGDDKRKYYGNYLATPYLSWAMLQHQVDNMDNYDHIVELSESFKKDLPAVIFDEQSVMPVLFSRIPELSALYQTSEMQVYRLNPSNQ